MKIKSFILKFSIIVLIFFAAVTSCKKDDQGSTYSYYVSKELFDSYTKGNINSMIDLASGLYPEVKDLKPFVSSGIKVYKVVYKTTVNGQQINASGLVCVPATSGDYPVLSFQNGTNTVNASAPSESASEYSHQFVEMIASMGYVVVFADYPGFGESVQVPHPYLVKEPTVQSLVDMLFAVKELAISELPGITLKDEYYLLGYSQGGPYIMPLNLIIKMILILKEVPVGQVHTIFSFFYRIWSWLQLMICLFTWLISLMPILHIISLPTPLPIYSMSLMRRDLVRCLQAF
jgi:hypothetical protein